MCDWPVYHCSNCGTTIHDGDLCEACQKERDLQSIDDDLWLEFVDERDEMRSLGMGR